MDQRELVVRAGKGDHDAFTVLVHGSVTRLDAIARLILRDTELARDAVQEAFIRAWRDLPRLREPERFDAWLHRLTVNACLDRPASATARRSRSRSRRSTFPAVGDTSGALADREFVDARACGASSAGRAIVVLHYYLGMPLPEVAATLGIPIGTAKSRLHRALGEMRVASRRRRRPRRRVPGGQLA